MFDSREIPYAHVATRNIFTGSEEDYALEWVSLSSSILSRLCGEGAEPAGKASAGLSSRLGLHIGPKGSRVDPVRNQPFDTSLHDGLVLGVGHTEPTLTG